MVAGAPRGHLYSIGLAAPIGSTDVELNQNDNLDGPGVLNTESASGRSAERGRPDG